MKKFLKIPVLLFLFAAGTLLSGCTTSAGVGYGYGDVGPYYGAGPYYGRAYPYYGRAYGYRPYARPYYRNRTVIVTPAPRRAPRGVVRGSRSQVRPNTTYRRAPQSSFRSNSMQGRSQGSVQGGSRGRVR